MRTVFKLILPVLILLFLLTSVAAKDITLRPGDSYQDEDKNLTLLKLEQNKALVCINNQKGIVAKDKRVDINGIIVEMTDYGSKEAEFDIEIPNCYKCECKDDCLNLLCPEPEKPEPTTTSTEVEDQSAIDDTNQEQSKIQTIEIVEDTGISSTSIFAVLLIIVVCLLGIYILWKKIS